MTNKIYYTIYQITHIGSGKIYIGYHKTSDLNDGYFGSGVYIKRAIKKYGRSQFTKQILYVFDNEEAMIAKEQEIVNEDFYNSKSTFNMCLGGRGNGFSSATPQQRKDWAKTASDTAAKKRRGTTDSEETRKKRGMSVSAARKGKPFPQRLQPVVIDGVRYCGIKEVIEVLGVSRPTILKRINSNDWSWHYD